MMRSHGCKWRLGLFGLWICLVLTGSGVHATGYTGLYVFGGMLEENGNYSSPFGQDYFMPGRFSNGFSYVELVADSLGLPPLEPSSLGGTNYAYYASLTDRAWQGKPVPTVVEQVENYLSAFGDHESADSGALYIVNCGWMEPGVAGQSPSDTEGNRDKAEATAVKIIACIQALADRGARHFATLQIFDITPFVRNPTPAMVVGLAAISQFCMDYNEALSRLVHGLDGVDVSVISTARWVSSARKTLNCINSYSELRPDSHPDDHFMLEMHGDYPVSGAAHRVLASVVLAAINRPPMAVNPIEDVSLVADTEKWRFGLLSSPRVFVDEDGDNMVFAASSSDTAVASVAISGTTLEVSPKSARTVTIELSATDPRGRVARSDFQV